MPDLNQATRGRLLYGGDYNLEQYWPSRWALGWQGKPSERVDYQRIVKQWQWHASLWRQNIAVDFVRVPDGLSRYALVLAPALHVLSTADAEHLGGYAADGGSLVAGYLTGTVDETTRLHPGGYQAAALREALGVFVEEFHPLDEGETEPCESAEVGAFDRGLVCSGPALRRRTGPDSREAARQAGVEPAVAGLPAGVEAVRRGAALVLLNHNAEAVAIAAGPASGSDAAGGELPGYGAVLRAGAPDHWRDSPQ